MFLLIFLGAFFLNTPQIGVWELESDDDKPGEVLSSETMYLFEDGTLWLVAPDNKFECRYRIDKGQFVMVLPNGKEISRQVEISEKYLRLKNQKIGWVHYRKIDMPLPETSENTDWTIGQVGPLTCEHHGSWYTMKREIDRGVSFALINETPPMNLLITAIKESREFDYQAALTDLMNQFMSNSPLPGKLELNKGGPLAFHGFEGDSLFIENDIQGTKVMIRGTMRSIGDHVVLVVTMTVPGISDMEALKRAMSSLTCEEKQVF